MVYFFVLRSMERTIYIYIVVNIYIHIFNTNIEWINDLV